MLDDSMPLQQHDELGRDMKKSFASVEDVLEFKDYVVVLKKVIQAGEIANADYFLVIDFAFKNNETAPFLYIGTITTAWKKTIQNEYKQRKTFVQGTCSVVGSVETGFTLELGVLKGKGDTSTNLKTLNTDLLKKLHLKAVFVELKGAEETEEEEETTKTTTSQANPKELLAHIKQNVQKLQALGSNQEEADLLKKQIEQNIADWTTLSQQTPPSPEEQLFVQKVKAYLGQSNKLDSFENQLETIWKKELTEYMSIREQTDDWSIIEKALAEAKRCYDKWQTIPQLKDDAELIGLSKQFIGEFQALKKAFQVSQQLDALLKTIAETPPTAHQPLLEKGAALLLALTQISLS